MAQRIDIGRSDPRLPLPVDQRRIDWCAHPHLKRWFDLVKAGRA
ncbi:hypothetical protein ACQ5SK_28495 [Bradyrhizobium japonicum]